MNSSWKVRNYALLALLLLGKLFFVAAPATAQSSSEMERAAALLPAQSRAVVERLTSLAQLPPGTWKMHVGDVTHGERVYLDESGWQVMAPGTDAPTSAVWFRQTIQVPETLLGYDLTGARIWFQFHADANGPMAEVLYFNGRRVDMGESDLEPIVLFDNARPGDKAVIATQFFETVNAKHFRGATLRVDFPENRPNPEDLAQEFLSAALLLPSLAPGDAGKMDTLNSAIRAVDVSALDAAETASGDARTQDEAEFDASLKAAQGQLEALRPLLQAATFHLTGNSHIDAAWLWPWTEAVDVVRRTFGTSLQLMNEYPAYTYTQSAAAYNEWMADKYPDLNAQIKKRIQEGRWEIVGGMWVEPDLNMPDGESLVRQLLVGKRWYKQAYGVDVRIGWNPDSFGYTWQLPQIYKKSGIDYFVTQKMTWNDTNQLPFKLFWWQSPDGSKVLTYFPHDYANDTLGPVRLSEDLAVARERAPGMTEMMDLYGVGDHGGGPTRVMLDQGFHWADPGATAIAADGGALVTPKYQFGTAQSYFSAVEKQIAPESPVWNYQSIAKGYEAPAAVPEKWRFRRGIPRCISNFTAASTPRRPITKRTCATAKRRFSTRKSGRRWRGLTARAIPARNSLRTGRRCSSTSSTIWPRAPASRWSTRTHSRTMTGCACPRMRFRRGRWKPSRSKLTRARRKRIRFQFSCLTHLAGNNRAWSMSERR